MSDAHRREAPLRVGIVSDTYPPYKHVSARRADSFAHALTDLGCKVTVLTGNDPDAGATFERGRIDVLRVPSPAMSENHERAAPARLGATSVARKTLTMGRLVTAGPYPAWVRATMAEVDRRSIEPCDILWAIHGRLSTLALAGRLAAHWACPWVADFKDHWSVNVTGWSSKVFDQATRRHTKGSTLITAASWLEAMQVSQFLGRPVTAVYTGFDPPPTVIDMGDDRTRPIDDDARFRIVWTGNISPRSRYEVAFEGIRTALETIDDVAFHFFGYRGDEVRALLGRRGDEIFVDHGFRPAADVQAAQRRADLLLHLPAVRKPTLSVKSLEYLSSQRPVLVVPFESDPELWSFVDGESVIAAPDAEAVADRVVGLYKEWQASGRRPDAERDLRRFTSVVQSRILLEVLTRAHTGSGWPMSDTPRNEDTP